MQTVSLKMDGYHQQMDKRQFDRHLHRVVQLIETESWWHYDRFFREIKKLMKDYFHFFTTLEVIQLLKNGINLLEEKIFNIMPQSSLSVSSIILKLFKEIQQIKDLFNELFGCHLFRIEFILYLAAIKKNDASFTSNLPPIQLMVNVLAKSANKKQWSMHIASFLG
jgi:hypothetical protein